MSADTTQAAVLELRGIDKHFGAVHALRGVDVSVHAGEVVGLVGDNGAGKSTLVSVISGTIVPDAGEIRLEGVPKQFNTPLAAQKAGIETVFQNLSLIPTLDIAANVFLHRELFRSAPLMRRLRWMDKRRMRRIVLEQFERLGLALPGPKTKVAGLSGGQRQAVALLRAVHWGGRIVVLDEPTAALGVKQTEIVLAFVERLREEGVAVIFISHNMEHVMRAADRVVVMRLGSKVRDVPADETHAAEVVGWLTGAITQ